MGLFESKRAMTKTERDLANKVFTGFVDYDRVSIGDHVGAGGAPWTSHFAGHYTLHMGANAYPDCTAHKWYPGVGYPDVTMIHELTHVWQGQHCWAHGWYMVQSVLSQASAILRTGDRDNAYSYTAGADWGSYNVEQQANIVEDWYKDGCKTTSPLFPYLRDNIRR